MKAREYWCLRLASLKPSFTVCSFPSLLAAWGPPPAPQDARLWYGIGLLYDCYGSYGHAIEAFDACLKMDPNFELDHEASWGSFLFFPVLPC